MFLKLYGYITFINTKNKSLFLKYPNKDDYEFRNDNTKEKVENYIESLNLERSPSNSSGLYIKYKDINEYQEFVGTKVEVRVLPIKYKFKNEGDEFIEGVYFLIRNIMIIV